MSLLRFSNPVVYKTYHKREIFDYIVSTEVDGTDFAANPSFDTTPLFQSASRENASVVAPCDIQTSNPSSLLSVDPNNSVSFFEPSW